MRLNSLIAAIVLVFLVAVPPAIAEAGQLFDMADAAVPRESDEARELRHVSNMPGPYPDAFAPNTYLHFIVGYQAELLGDLETAVKEYKIVVRVDRLTAYVRAQLSEVLLKLDRVDEAEAMAMEALHLEPDNIKIMTLLAQILNVQKKTTEAIEIYERIVEAEPDNDSIRLQLAVLVSNNGDFSRAEEIIRHSSDDDAKASGYYYIGMIALGMEKDRIAIKAFKQSIKFKPDLDRPYHYLGIIAQKDNKFRKAEKYYLRALEISPDNIEVIKSLSQLYIDNKKIDKAIEMEKALSNLRPESPDPFLKMGLFYMNQNMLEEAARALESAVKLGPEDLELRYYYAIALDGLKDYDKALAQYEFINKEAPNNTKVLLNMSYLYSVIERNDKAAETYEKLIALKTDVPDYYVYLARIYFDLKRNEDALRVLTSGLELFETHAELHFTLSIYHEKNGNFDGIIKHLKRTIELDPGHAEAMNFLGYSYAEKGVLLEEALGLIKKSLALKPGNGYITDSLGWVYFKMGKYKKALKALQKAYEIVKDDPVILEHLGDAYHSAGKIKKARKSWELSLKAQEESKKDKDLIERVNKKIKDLSDK